MNSERFNVNKIFVILFSFLLTLPSFALEQIEYKNIKDGSKISFDGINWTEKIKKRNSNYYVKKIPESNTKYSEFYSSQNEFLFSTGCEYEFIHKGSLLGYSNQDLKFYEFTLDNNNILQQRALTQEEVQALFQNYKIVKVSDFATNTNSFKIKKKQRHLKLILLNDTDKYFNNYGFSSNNAKFKQYELKGFLDISKKGMIQFSRFGENSKNSPWYIILVR